VLRRRTFLHCRPCSAGARAKDSSIRGRPQVGDSVHEASVDWHPCGFRNACAHHRVECPSRESARRMVSVCSSWHKQGMTIIFACHKLACTARCMWLRTNPGYTRAKVVTSDNCQTCEKAVNIELLLSGTVGGFDVPLDSKPSCRTEWRLQATLSPLNSRASFNSNSS
jgi:hypothetical protein